MKGLVDVDVVVQKGISECKASGGAVVDVCEFHKMVVGVLSAREWGGTCSELRKAKTEAGRLGGSFTWVPSPSMIDGSTSWGQRERV